MIIIIIIIITVIFGKETRKPVSRASHRVDSAGEHSALWSNAMW